MKKSICFFTARYSHSGVPLAQMRLAKAFLRKGYRVYFVLGYVPDGVLEPDGEGVTVLNFNQPRVYKLLIPIFQFIRAKCPEIIFSAEDHLNAIVTLSVVLARSKARLSVSSRVTPYDTYSSVPFSKRWVLKHLSQLLWRRADALTCVSKDMVQQYAVLFGKTKHICIYNVIIDSDFQRKMSEPVEHPWFADKSTPLVISAGRLAPEKGFHDLIAAIKLVNDHRPVRLVILGDGPLKDDLEYLVTQLNLEHFVQMIGFQANPLKFFGKARLFVLSSYVEGLPNVLVEAMACGCPVVSTNCPTGPREVLRDGEFGELIPVGAPNALAEAILRALDVAPDQESLKAAVFPFTEEEVINIHKNALALD